MAPCNAPSSLLHVQFPLSDIVAQGEYRQLTVAKWEECPELLLAEWQYSKDLWHSFLVQMGLAPEKCHDACPIIFSCLIGGRPHKQEECLGAISDPQCKCLLAECCG